MHIVFSINQKDYSLKKNCIIFGHAQLLPAELVEFFFGSDELEGAFVFLRWV